MISLLVLLPTQVNGFHHLRIDQIEQSTSKGLARGLSEETGYLAATTFSDDVTPACYDPSTKFEVACCNSNETISSPWPSESLLMTYDEAETNCSSLSLQICSQSEMTQYGAVSSGSTPTWSRDSCTTSSTTSSTTTSNTTANSTTTSNTKTNSQTSSSTDNSSGGRTVLYFNNNTSLPGGLASVIQDVVNAGFNTLVMSFYTPNSTYNGGSVDSSSMADFWAQLPNSDKSASLDLVHGVGGSIMLSMGGQYVNFNTSLSFIQGNGETGGSPYYTLGAAFGQYAMDYMYDGVDYDLENFATADFKNLAVQTLLADLVQGARSINNSFVISSAPQGPYMGSTWGPVSDCSTTANCDTTRPYGLCAYHGLCTESWGLDFIFVQYYNQGDTNYITYEDLFEKSAAYPGSAVEEMTTGSDPYLDSSKLVVGKPITQTDLGDGSGLVALPTLKQWFCQYQQSGLQVGGAGFWEYRDDYTSEEGSTDLEMAGGMMDPAKCNSDLYSTTTTTTTTFQGTGYLAATTFDDDVTPQCNNPDNELEVACCDSTGTFAQWPKDTQFMTYANADSYCRSSSWHICSQSEMNGFTVSEGTTLTWSSDECNN